MPSRRPETTHVIKNRSHRFCSKCGKCKQRSEFHRDSRNLDGLYPACKICRKTLSKKSYIKNRKTILEKSRQYRNTDVGKSVHRKSIEQSQKKFPEKHRARTKLQNAVRDKRVIKPSKCDACGSSEKLHGHHDDYSKPLDVLWLCNPCHQLAHQ